MNPDEYEDNAFDEKIEVNLYFEVFEFNLF